MEAICAKKYSLPDGRRVQSKKKIVGPFSTLLKWLTSNDFWDIQAVKTAQRGLQKGLKTHLQAPRGPGSLLKKKNSTDFGPILDPFLVGTRRPKHTKTRLNVQPAGETHVQQCVWTKTKGWKPPKVRGKGKRCL